MSDKARDSVAQPAPPKEKTVTKVAVSSGQCMYIGPSRPFGLPLMRHAILRGAPEAIHPGLSDLFAAHPPLRDLFVPIAQLADARRLLGIAGSSFHLAFEAVKSASAAARVQE